MSYAGTTITIPCDQGGLNASPNIDTVPPTAMVLVRNINLHKGGRGRRGGTSKVDSSPMSGSPRVMGIFDYRLASGTQWIVRGTTDGKIYKNQSTTIKTGLTTGKVVQFEYYKDVLYICNGADRPQTWDGAAASTSNLTNVPTDWSTNGWPQQIVKHGRGASERLWALCVTGNKNAVYASADGGADFSDGNVTKIVIDTHDGDGIVGGVEYGDRLFAFGKRKSYVIEDTDTTVANWGYSAAQWEGGVAHHRLIVVTPNDLVCMMEDGEIYSVTAAQEYGDYKAASIARPAFIHQWIKDNVNLAYIADFHAVYDPDLRAIRFFFVRSGQTQIKECLTYFIDLGPTAGWVVHDNRDYASGFNASCSVSVRVSTGVWQIYTGDYAGTVWKLETASINDDSNPYYSGFKTPAIPLVDSGRVTCHIRRGWVTTRTQGNYNVSANVWVDGALLGTYTISLAGVGATWGSFTWGSDVWGGANIINAVFELGTTGKRLQVEIYNTNADEDFFISSIQLDMKPLGARPS